MPDAVSGYMRGITSADVRDEVTQTLKRSSESLDHIARESLRCYTDTMTAAMQSGTETSQLLTEMGRSGMQSFASAASAVSDLAQDGMNCRTPHDVVALQKKGFDAVNTAFASSARLWSEFYDALSKTAQPVVEKAADVPERMFQAIAE